ncbi:tyrosine-type recombinase/integrase [Halostella pelagica]|uniref:tyrosine-type recombinase/integrase n=1 Tax=Halostella pelagica TaxID=2583824 RepID=UPI0010821643|nr:tyrosine-type recombinase/integrase [Halostella pelagica]
MTTTEYIDVDGALQNLKDDVSQRNYEAIKQFINHTAAEGIGESQQQRHIYAWKTILKKFVDDEFAIPDTSKNEIKHLVAELNRSDYAEATKHKFRSAVKKLYTVRNDGKQPEKVQFFSVHKNSKPTSVSREDLFRDEELKRLLRSFGNTRDRAFTYVLYESAARPGELISRNVGDFTSNAKGDFIYLEGAKGTPDRTNQLVRSGRPLREWISSHPLGGEPGDIQDPGAPLWVKTEQQVCKTCGEIPHSHDDTACNYESDLSDRMKYAGFYRRFKDACKKAEIPENKRKPYNLRHTRLTEVATFMGYEQLNKFAGWKPGSDRAKVYVHLNNDDVNQAIRDEYGISSQDEEKSQVQCSFCGTSNDEIHTECRNCGRPLSLEQQSNQEEKLEVLERLAELEEKGILDQLDAFTRETETSS